MASTFVGGARLHADIKCATTIFCTFSIQGLAIDSMISNIAPKFSRHTDSIYSNLEDFHEHIIPWATPIASAALIAKLWVPLYLSFILMRTIHAC